MPTLYELAPDLFPETKPRRSKIVCRCPAYKFPHRRGSGQCTGDHQFCSCCKQPAMGEWHDFGIGSYEYGGGVQVDSNKCFVSECCEVPMTEWTGREIDPKFP